MTIGHQMSKVGQVAGEITTLTHNDPSKGLLCWRRVAEILDSQMSAVLRFGDLTREQVRVRRKTSLLPFFFLSMHGAAGKQTADGKGSPSTGHLAHDQ